jgi:hypothetical protein
MRRLFATGGLALLLAGCLMGTIMMLLGSGVPRDRSAPKRYSFISSAYTVNPDGYSRECRFLSDGQELGRIVDVRKGDYYHVAAVCYMNGKTKERTTSVGLGASYVGMQSWLIGHCL